MKTLSYRSSDSLKNYNSYNERECANHSQNASKVIPGGIGLDNQYALA